MSNKIELGYKRLSSGRTVHLYTYDHEIFYIEYRRTGAYGGEHVVSCEPFRLAAVYAEWDNIDSEDDIIWARESAERNERIKQNAR